MVQSFTVPDGATVLEKFTWSGFDTIYPYTLALYGFDGAQLTTDALWWETRSDAPLEHDLLTFLPGAAVTAGNVYAIGLSVAAGGQTVPVDFFPGGSYYTWNLFPW